MRERHSHFCLRGKSKFFQTRLLDEINCSILQKTTKTLYYENGSVLATKLQEFGLYTFIYGAYTLVSFHNPHLFNSQLITNFVFMNIKQYLEINPEKRFGKPIIKGTRISVADVLNWLANGMSREEIISDFPELCKEQINACLFYAASREGHLGIAS